MRFPLVVTCRRSAPVFALVVGIHLCGVAAVLAAGGASDAVRLIAVTLLLLSLGASARAWRAAHGQFRLSIDGGSEYRLGGGDEFQPAECCWRTVWPQLAVAGFRLPGRKRRVGFVLLPGVLAPEELRLFRVWLLNCRAKAD